MNGVTLDVTGGLAELTLDRPKVNALDSATLAGLAEAFGRVASDASIRGVLVRAEGRCFSAGLDLMEVAGLDRDGMTTFFGHFDGAFRRAFQCPKPVAVGVEGHAIAGGLILAFTGDYLAFGPGDYTLALTELQVGVPFPVTAMEIVRSATTPRTMRQLVYQVARVGPAQALAMGLGDAIADDPVADARAWLELAVSRPAPAFLVSKANHRAPYWERVDAQQPEATARWLDGVFSDETRDAMLATFAATRRGS